MHLAKLELSVAGGEKVDGVDAEASIDHNQRHRCTHAGHCNCIGQRQHDLPNLHAQGAVRARWLQTLRGWHIVEAMQLQFQAPGGRQCRLPVLVAATPCSMKITCGAGRH